MTEIRGTGMWELDEDDALYMQYADDSDAWVQEEIQRMEKQDRKARQKERFQKKLHNAVLESITAIALVAFIISACCIDSANVAAPVAMMIVSFIWVVLFFYANEEHFRKEDRR